MNQINKLRKILVTGANRGIGYEIAKGLYSDSNPYYIILGSRDITRGQAAFNQIKKEVLGPNNIIEFHQLDVNDSKSVDMFISWAKSSLQTLDVLINNAGYGFQKQSPEEGIITLNTNFFSVVELTEKVLSILSDDGKIIQVSSLMGAFRFQGEKIQKKLDNPDLTKGELMDIANELMRRIKEGTYEELGWNSQHYHNSKCLLNAYTRWVLPRLLKEGQQCYCCSPGYCRTDMTSSDAPKSAEEGAKTPIFLVNLPFVKDEKYHRRYIEEEIPHSFY